MSRGRVLQLSKYYPPTFGGLELVAQFLSRALRDAGHPVDVLSLGAGPRRYAGDFGEEVWQENEDLKLSSAPFSVGQVRAFRRLLRERTPRLILVHLPHPFAHALVHHHRAELRGLGVKVVGVYHSDIINQVLLRDAYNLFFLSQADVYERFLCASPNLRDSSSILSRLPRSRVGVIPFCAEAIPGERWSLAQSRRAYLAIGRLVPYKGLEFLIETFNRLALPLTVAGSGPLEEKLRSLAGPTVTVLGKVSEEQKYQLLRSHRALVMSSINRSEAFGMTIVEAFSIGLPVIAADIDTGVSFLVRDEDTGLKFPILDAAELARQVRRLDGDDALAERLSRRGLEFFQRELCYEAFRGNLQRFVAAL